jgi:hypothetical protein
MEGGPCMAVPKNIAIDYRGWFLILLSKILILCGYTVPRHKTLFIAIVLWLLSLMGLPQFHYPGNRFEKLARVDLCIF